MAKRQPTITGVIAQFIVAFICVVISVALLASAELNWIHVVIPQKHALESLIDLPDGKFDPGNDGKLVHVTGQLGGSEILTDPNLGISADALKLQRRVLMWQWSQGHVKSKSTDTTEYNGVTIAQVQSRNYWYEQAWHDQVIDSRQFHDSGHDNPTEKPIPSREVTASNIVLGPFHLSPGLVKQIDDFHLIQPVESNVVTLPEPLRGEAKIINGEIFIGRNFKQPKTGDLKIDILSTPPTVASVIAKQDGASLKPYEIAHGASIELLRTGSYSCQNMITAFGKANLAQRLISWGMAWIALLMGGLLIMNIIWWRIGVFQSNSRFSKLALAVLMSIAAAVYASSFAILVVGLIWLTVSIERGLALASLAIVLAFVTTKLGRRTAAA